MDSTFHLSHQPPHYYYTLPLVLEMTHSSNSSNVIIHGGTFNSVQGDFHNHNVDSESGVHDYRTEEHPYQ